MRYLNLWCSSPGDQCILLHQAADYAMSIVQRSFCFVQYQQIGSTHDQRHSSRG